MKKKSFKIKGIIFLLRENVLSQSFYGEKVKKDYETLLNYNNIKNKFQKLKNLCAVGHFFFLPGKNLTHESVIHQQAFFFSSFLSSLFRFA